MNKNKGISLIVLVITIIVIIILSGSVILSLVKDNPIGKANEAKFKTNIDQYKSELTISLTNEYFNNNNFNPSTFNWPAWDGSGDGENTIKEYIPSITKEDGAKFEIQSSKLVYVGTDNVEKNWLTEIGIEDGVVTPPVFGVNVIATENVTINGAAAAYNNPIIPKGFKAINDGAVWPTDWNAGLVLEDANGNQFVWVPVDGTNVTYTNWAVPAAPGSKVTVDTLPAGITNEMNQITKYGGFYIGRYESGKEGVSTVVSKKLAPVWIDNYNNSRTRLVSMYNTAEVKSGLVTGKQWDSTMKWLQNLGKNVTTDSTAWGNFSNSIEPGHGIMQVAGFNENWKANNIYDLAGNASEWNNEIYYDDMRGSIIVCRVGSYNTNGNVYPYPAIQRDTNSTAIAGARVALFVL